MKAPVGAVVKIYVDLRARVAIGDAIQTGTGRRYLVIGVRVQQRGRHAGRQHLECVVGDGSELVAGQVYEIIWYRRRSAARPRPAGGGVQ